MNMRPDKQIHGLEDVIKDKNQAIADMHIEIKELRDEVLRLRNGLRMLLVADSWEEQPGPILVEYVNGLLNPYKMGGIELDEIPDFKSSYKE